MLPFGEGLGDCLPDRLALLLQASPRGLDFSLSHWVPGLKTGAPPETGQGSTAFFFFGWDDCPQAPDYPFLISLIVQNICWMPISLAPRDYLVLQDAL